MATGNESTIDTKLFAATADTVAAAVKELDRLCQDWARAMSSLRAEWQGDVSDDVKNAVEQVRKSSADLIANLSAYPTTLREIAGIYDQTERSVTEESRTLTFDRGGMR